MRSPNPPIISASILAADFANLADDCQAAIAAGVDWLHIDVMDGHYVPNLSFGADICNALRRSGINAPMDTHLMVSNPNDYIERFAKSTQLISVHPETCDDLNTTLETITKNNCKTGCVFNPDQNINLTDEQLHQVDLILVMSVFPGFGGQKFIPESANRICSLRERLNSINAKTRIGVDGGVTQDNLSVLYESGADVFVMGSEIFKQKKQHYSELLYKCKKLLNCV